MEKSRTFLLALVISVALHVWIFILVNRNPSSEKLSRAIPPLHIHIVAPTLNERNVHSKNARSQTADVPIKLNEKKVGQRQNKREHNASSDMIHAYEATTEQSRVDKPEQDVNASPPEQDGPSIDQLLESTKKVAREMAKHEAQNPVSSKSQTDVDMTFSAFGRAINNNQLTPGEYRLADGTIKVVTKFGTTYCIRPRNGSGIGTSVSIAVFCK